MRWTFAWVAVLFLGCGVGGGDDDGGPQREDIPEETECVFWFESSPDHGPVLELCGRLCIEPFSLTGTCDECAAANASLRRCFETGIAFAGTAQERRSN